MRGTHSPNQLGGESLVLEGEMGEERRKGGKDQGDCTEKGEEEEEEGDRSE